MPSWGGRSRSLNLRGLQRTLLSRYDLYSEFEGKKILASAPAFITGLCLDRLNRALDPS